MDKNLNKLIKLSLKLIKINQLDRSNILNLATCVHLKILDMSS